MPDDNTRPDALADELAACPWGDETLLMVLDSRRHFRDGGTERDTCRLYPGGPLSRDRLAAELADEGVTPSMVNRIKS